MTFSRWTLSGCTMLLTALSAAPAAAGAPVFETAPLSERSLASVTGGASPFGPLSRGQLAALADVQARTDQQFAAALGRNQMDVWWGSAGSELVASSVRMSLPR